MSTRRTVHPPGKGKRAGVALDEPSRRAIRGFIRVLARSGRSPEAILAEVRKACAEIPTAWSKRADTSYFGDASHVITLWFSDPAYLDALGNPRPIPLRGASPSIEALTRRVDPETDPRAVLRRMEKGGALQRTGRAYLPRDRALIFARPGDVTAALPGLFGLLKTLDHNSQRRRTGPKWLQLFARNPYFPVSALPAFERRIRRRIRRVVAEVDSQMHRYERARKTNEPTVRIGFGAYHFEEDPPAAAARPPKQRRGGVS